MMTIYLLTYNLHQFHLGHFSKKKKAMIEKVILQSFPKTCDCQTLCLALFQEVDTLPDVRWGRYKALTQKTDQRGNHLGLLSSCAWQSWQEVEVPESRPILLVQWPQIHGPLAFVHLPSQLGPKSRWDKAYDLLLQKGRDALLWGGDFNQEIKGLNAMPTFYYKNKGEALDQVILRSKEMEGETSVVQLPWLSTKHQFNLLERWWRGRSFELRPKKSISDHFPLLFKGVYRP